MDQPQNENKKTSIWNKFESAAPGVPDWIQNKEQTGSILHTLLKTIPAQSILISTTSEIFLLVGEIEQNTQQKILQVLNGFWDPVQKSDLTRYLKDANGQVTGFIFCANLFQQLIITLYYEDTPTLSMARAHAKRITRALSGQTVASYEAKTIPVDAAIAAQMRKIYEQKSKQSSLSEIESRSELPMVNTIPGAGPNTVKPPPIQPASPILADQQIEEAQASVAQHDIEELLPSVDELLGEHENSQAGIAEILTDQGAPEPFKTQPVDAPENSVDFIAAGVEEISQGLGEISEADLAQLSEEMDDFFMDEESSDIDLEEQKEKLAAMLQDIPSPDPEDAEQTLPEYPEASTVSAQAAAVSDQAFSLPWEGETTADKPETAPVDVTAEQPDEVPLETAMETQVDSPATETKPPASFQEAMQQVNLETSAEPRSFTIIIIPRIPFHQLGLSFEQKFEQYFQQTCQAIECEAETCQLFSDHIQLKIKFDGKGSVARTIMQIKKILELKIIENYSTFNDELGGKELWIPGQLLFSEQEKLDSKRIQEFIKNAQS